MVKTWGEWDVEAANILIMIDEKKCVRPFDSILVRLVRYGCFVSTLPSTNACKRKLSLAIRRMFWHSKVSKLGMQCPLYTGQYPHQL